MFFDVYFYCFVYSLFIFIVYSILLYEQITFYLFITIKNFIFITLLIGIWVVPVFSYYNYCCYQHPDTPPFICLGASVSVGVCLGVELLGVMINAKVTLGNCFETTFLSLDVFWVCQTVRQLLQTIEGFLFS